MIRDEQVLSALRAVNGKLESIHGLLVWIAVLLFAILLGVTFPDWRGIFD